MRKIGVREFRKNLAKELKDLPIELVKNGSIIAVVCTPSLYGADKPAQHFNPQPKGAKK